MFKVGIAGTVITAICCFTPILPLFLGAVGLSILVQYLDMFLIPALGIFIVILIVGAVRRRST